MQIASYLEGGPLRMMPLHVNQKSDFDYDDDFLTLDFSKQNGVSCKLSNIVTNSYMYKTFLRTKASAK